MLITILAPEVLITLNTGQLMNALKTVERFKEFAEADGVPWSLTHSLFASIGGSVLTEYMPERVGTSSHIGSRGQSKGVEMEETDRAEDRIQIAGGIPPGKKSASKENFEAQPRKEPRSIFLVAERLRRSGIIKLPYITRDEIMDKGKSDSFARVIAVSQTLWLVLQSKSKSRNLAARNRHGGFRELCSHDLCFELA